MKDIIQFLKNFLRELPNNNSKVFDKNQNDAEDLVSELKWKDTEIQKSEAQYQAARDKRIQLQSNHAEFLSEDGFTPEYISEKRSRVFVLLFTPIFSGLSIATGIYIIFGISVELAILAGLILSFLSFFLALNDKFLERNSKRRSYSFIIFLTLDAVILIVGLTIGLISQIPKGFLIAHSLLCVFAVVLNFLMLKHSSKHHEDSVRKKIKRNHDGLKSHEKQLEKNLESQWQEVRRIFNGIRKLAIRVRRDFVAHNYDPSTVRMSRDTRMVLNQIFGYDLFPITGERILPTDYRWDTEQITNWPENDQYALRRIIPRVWPYLTTGFRPVGTGTAAENGSSQAEGQSQGDYNTPEESVNPEANSENPHSNQDTDTDNPGVNQPYDSETEL